MPGATEPAGSFNITQLGDKADKIGKDTDFRGLTVFDNVVCYAKGSGGNGVNTVYFIDTTGKACPNGTGLPQPGAALPTSAIDFNPASLQTLGVFPYNMCVLRGFPTGLAKNDTTSFVRDRAGRRARGGAARRLVPAGDAGNPVLTVPYEQVAGRVLDDAPRHSRLGAS